MLLEVIQEGVSHGAAAVPAALVHCGYLAKSNLVHFCASCWVVLPFLYLSLQYASRSLFLTAVLLKLPGSLLPSWDLRKGRRSGIASSCAWNELSPAQKGIRSKPSFPSLVNHMGVSHRAAPVQAALDHDEYLE